jgi:peptidoglycan/xylan/chitin deacetylase (PgdA/CDA1 family)
MHENERLTTLESLASWAGVPGKVPTDRRSLSSDEACALIDGELIEAGSHTVTHPVLSALPRSAQLGEVRQSKRELEQLLGRQIRCFAYPYGCCTLQTASVVGDEGFLCACSVQPGIFTYKSCLFALPRVKVEDWASEELSRVLSELLGE